MVEVISKSTREFDYEVKPVVYEKAGVRECFFVDPMTAPWTIAGRRLDEGSGRYQLLELGAAGWLAPRSTGLRFRLGQDGASLEVEESATGERLRNLSEEAVAREAAELRAGQEAAEE